MQVRTRMPAFGLFFLVFAMMMQAQPVPKAGYLAAPESIPAGGAPTGVPTGAPTGATAGNPAGQSRSILFFNGTIHVDSTRTVSNLLVRDSRVVAQDVDPALYPEAERVDLSGGAAYPGFNDSHVHLVATTSAMATGVALNGASRAEDIARIVAGRCASLPPGIPIVAHGFVLDNYDAWSLADLAVLDATTGDRPVIIADQLGHSYIANSAALRLGRVDGTTRSPPGGKIVLENGKPTGMLRETAGILVGNTAIFPRIPDELIRAPLIQLLGTWASMGYTSIVELMGAPLGRMFKPELLRELEREGKLPLRVDYAYTFFSLDDLDGLGDAGADTDLVKFAGLKLFVDGAAGNGGAWTSFTNQLGDQGLFAVYDDDSFGPEYNINRIVAKADDLGLDVHYHVGGDRSIDIVLKAIEKVKEAKGRLNSVHTLYHLGFLTDAQIGRMKAIRDSIVLGIQPSLHWEYSRQITPRFYGEHAAGTYPYRKMADAGLTLALSTDFASNLMGLCWPTVIAGISMTGGGAPAANPPLTLPEVIAGFTTGGFASTRRKDVGILDPGWLADIVVFERDLASVPPGELAKDNPRVLATYVSGRKVYSAPGR